MSYRQFSQSFGKMMTKSKLAALASLMSVGCVTIYSLKKQQPLLGKTALNETDLDSLTDHLQDSHQSKTRQCDQLIERYKEVFGIPGVIVGVSKNGQTVYSKGFGYADVENGVPAHSSTVVRIASISKPITTAIAAKLFENGKLDFDKTVNDYLDHLPVFKWNDRTVKITPRQLVSHTAGIRHYTKTLESEETENESSSKNSKTEKPKEKVEKNTGGDTQFKEFYLNKNFKTTKEALEVFINDPLLYEPGQKYYYTTHGFTLLSAVLEKACEARPFSSLMTDLFGVLQMTETYLDQNDPVIPNRSRYYSRNEQKRLVNVPYVDNSYKWAGGGLLSTVNDLTKFGNHMLTFYQNTNEQSKLFLKSSTLAKHLWSPQSKPEEKEKERKQRDCFARPNDQVSYGMGWFLVHDETNALRYVYHTGGAVGAISCLLIVPDDSQGAREVSKSGPEGLVVAVLCNSDTAAEIVKLSLNISKIFSD